MTSRARRELGGSTVQINVDIARTVLTATPLLVSAQQAAKPDTWSRYARTSARRICSEPCAIKSAESVPTVSRVMRLAFVWTVVREIISHPRVSSRHARLGYGELDVTNGAVNAWAVKTAV